MNDSEIVEGAATDDFSLIDGSTSDDDFLLASSSDVSTAGNPGDILAEKAPTNQAPDSDELEKPRKYGKCNLRKSLAWDSAFFTNAGVLDPEELSSIIEGAETSSPKHILPGIEEDLTKSYDSISTFESDSLTIESLEADLFCDIRASIQRTSRSSAQGNCSSTKAAREIESTYGGLTKPVEISSGTTVKPKLASKKPTSSVHGPLRTLEPGPISKQVAKPAVRGKETKSLLPQPPEAAVKSCLIGAATTKRTPIRTGHAKLDSNTAGNSKGKVASLSKVSYQANSSNTVPKTLASSKLTSGSSVLGRAAAVHSSRSSCDSVRSFSSETIRKSQGDLNRRKMDKKATLPSGSKVRDPSRVPLKSKCRSGDSHLSDYLKSTSKLSPSISPASSISEWSIESSSSTATDNKKPIVLMPCPTSTQEILMESNAPQSQIHSGDSAHSGHENHLAGLDQSAKRPSTVSSVPLSRPGSAKPSGLRMPSAKLGFFDGGKAAAKTPSGSSRSRPALPSNSPRSGALNGSPSRTANNLTAVVKPGPRRTNMNHKPIHLGDQSTGVPEILNVKKVELISVTSSKVSNISTLDPTLEENGEVLNGGKHMADCTSDAGKDIILVGARKEASPDGELQSTNQSAIAAEDLHNLIHVVAAEDLNNLIHVVDGMKDLSANPSSEEGKSDRNASSDVDNVHSSQEVGESDSLNIRTIHLCQEASSVEGPSNGEASSDMDGVDSPEVSNIISPNPTLEENGEVLNGGEHVADCTSEAGKGIILVAARKEASPDGKPQSSINQSAIAAEDLHSIIHIADGMNDLSANPSSDEGTSNRKASSDESCVHSSQEVVESDSLVISTVHPCQDASPVEGQSNGEASSDMDGVYSSQKFGESDSLNLSTGQACQDVGQSEGHGPTNADQNREHGAFVAQQIGLVETQLDGFGTQMESANKVTEVQNISNGTFQSKNLINEDNSLSFLSCPKELSNEELRQSANLNPGARTPLATKNSVAHLIEVYNSSSKPAFKASVKFNTLPSLEEGQKENC